MSQTLKNIMFYHSGNQDELIFCNIGHTPIYLYGVNITLDNVDYACSFRNGHHGQWFRVFYNNLFYVTCNTWGFNPDTNEKLYDVSNYMHTIKKEDIKTTDILLNDIFNTF